MFDKELLKKALKTVIDSRNDELKSLQELNGFTEEDNNAYVALTEEYAKQLEDLDKTEVVSKDDYLRLAADFDNYRKRTAKSEQNAHDKAEESCLLHFLHVYDNLALLIENLENKDTGISLVFKDLEQTLADQGCEKIDCSYGDKFDVSIMEAIAVREIADDEGYDPNDIVEIYQTGWKLNGKVIRPVKVVVGKEKEENNEKDK